MVASLLYLVWLYIMLYTYTAPLYHLGASIETWVLDVEWLRNVTI